jgi:hypothetical protein
MSFNNLFSNSLAHIDPFLLVLIRFSGISAVDR